MTSLPLKPKIVVIVGPTATGKSDLAVHIAEKFNGEVISADSRQVYKGMNIGTGKITKKEMKGVTHYLLDVADPKRRFTVVKYVKLAEQAIRKIIKKGKLPIVCGGTGFYIDALIGGTQFPTVTANPALRSKLAKLSVEQLYATLMKIDPHRAEGMNRSDRQNPRRLVRAIEIVSATKKGRSLPDSQPAATSQMEASIPSRHNYAPFFIGLKLPPDELKERIHRRLLKRLTSGMVAEAKRLHRQGLSWTRMEELGLEYRYLARFIQGKITKAEMIAQLNTEIWHYARRQMTWFRRDGDINWFSPDQSMLILKLIGRCI